VVRLFGAWRYHVLTLERVTRRVDSRFWRWHAGWCPGFRAYMKSLPDDKRIELATRYQMEKYK
jgi:hypothetical protein